MGDKKTADNGGVYKSEIHPIQAWHERSHQSDKDFDQFFNDMGFVIRGRTEDGHDIHLWTFHYQQRGAEVVLDGDITQSLFMAAKFSDEEKKTMHDIPYVNKGQNIEDYQKPGTIVIKEDGDKTEWGTPERGFECHPPNWRVTGGHAGVKVDIKYTSNEPGFFHLGSFEDLPAKGGLAGYVMHGKTEGTMEVAGKVHKFKGYGVHERIIQSGIVPDRTHYMGGRGLNWMHSWSEDFSWYGFQGDVGSGAFTGILYHGGKSYAVSGDQGGIEETLYWLDPKSKIQIPYRWKVWFNTPVGRMESEVYGYGRGYYTWIRRHGTMVVNQYLADASSKLTLNDGSVVESKQQSMIEHMRTMYRQPEPEGK